MSQKELWGTFSVIRASEPFQPALDEESDAWVQLDGEMGSAKAPPYMSHHVGPPGVQEDGCLKPAAAAGTVSLDGLF